MATIGTRIHTLLHGRCVGRDEFGNRYYEERGRVSAGRRRKRWVMFKGIAEPSKVPPEWHGWLHHTLDAPLSSEARYSWQKPHIPNLTGTKHRYLPKGHLLSRAVRAATKADYVPWKPE
jgi:NADH:ubiquinone oxidoreductase subunit